MDRTTPTARAAATAPGTAPHSKRHYHKQHAKPSDDNYRYPGGHSVVADALYTALTGRAAPRRGWHGLPARTSENLLTHRPGWGEL